MAHSHINSASQIRQKRPREGKHSPQGHTAEVERKPTLLLRTPALPAAGHSQPPWSPKHTGPLPLLFVFSSRSAAPPVLLADVQKLKLIQVGLGVCSEQRLGASLALLHDALPTIKSDVNISDIHTPSFCSLAAAKLADGSFKGIGLEQGLRLLAPTCPFCRYKLSVTLAASGAKPGLVFNYSHRTLF